MAVSSNLLEHANFTRLSRLLVDKGTEALRITLDAIHPPANLPAVLKANISSLRKLKPRVINDLQWNLLFPSSGDPPDSKTFDVTLLTVLLRNICWSTHPPVMGWNTMPPDSDRSPQANVLRIKLFRNEVYAHVTSTRMDEAVFENLWQKISQALVDLNIPRKKIDDLKISALGPEEESYVEIFKEWFLKEKDRKSMLDDLTTSVGCLAIDVHNLRSDMRHLTQKKHELVERPERADSEVMLQKLAKHNFNSKLARKVESFHPGTREWLLKDLNKWFTTEDESRLLLLTAGPGFGKSVFAAKVCELYRECGNFGACHFCDFSNSNLKNPLMMLESLASHMGENLAGFKELLLDQLKRHHTVHNLNDAFQIYLQNPLDEFEGEPFLIVIDGLDESATDLKSDMVKLIVDHFPDLPKCVKVLITSRPELSLQKLDCVKKIEIDANDENNKLDLQQYLMDCLSPLPQVPGRYNDVWYIPGIARKCEGSFLYAFHVQRDLRQRKDFATMTYGEIMSTLPQGLGSVYKKYFERLENELKAVVKDEIKLFKLLEVLVAAYRPLPLRFIARTLGLDLDCRDTKRIIGKVNDAISCLLYVSDDLVTVFHKSVCDWLLARGYEDHEYAVKASDGTKQLWLLSEMILEEIKECVILGKDLKMTNEVKHALENGYDYLMERGLTDSFGWLVDMVILYVLLNKFPDGAPSFLSEIWFDILSGDAAVSPPLRQRISWHFAEFSCFKEMALDFGLSKVDLYYLETVIAYSPKDCFTESEISTAKSLVAKSPRCVKRDSIRATAMKTLLAKPVSSEVTAVGVSSNRQLAAVALFDGTVFILSLPELVTTWQYSIDHECSCCTFAPNDSKILIGKLETVLCIEKKKEITYFKGIKEQFMLCTFSANGKRLVTNDGSNAIKLWDVARQSLMSVLYSGVPLNSCSFSNTGFFIISYNKSAMQDSYCVWSAITFQRVDVRSLLIDKPKKEDKSPKREICNRCSRKEHAAIWGFNGPKISIMMSHPNSLFQSGEMFSGVYNDMDCIFSVDDESLGVFECIHFSMLAAWDIFRLTHCASRYSRSEVFDVTWIAGNAWLVSTRAELLVCSTGVPEDHACSSRPTLVLWCSFSLDSTRLATCTSDGFVNLWNVNSCQIYQRVRHNIETFLVACCWSNNQLFVFHLTEEIHTFTKYYIDENFEIDLSKVESVSLCCLVNEFEGFSSVLEFSQGYLSFKTVGSVKILNINTTENPEVTFLPNSESIEDIAISTDASAAIGALKIESSVLQETHLILWKRKQCQPVEYEGFFDIPIPFSMNVFCCFSNNVKYAVAISAVDSLQNSFVVVNVSTGTLIIKSIGNWSCHPSVSKIFCTGMAVIFTGKNFIEIKDILSGETFENSFLLHEFLNLSKLSPDGRIIAASNVTGGMEFFRLSIPAESNMNLAEAGQQVGSLKKRKKQY